MIWPSSTRQKKNSLLPPVSRVLKRRPKMLKWKTMTKRTDKTIRIKTNRAVKFSALSKIDTRRIEPYSKANCLTSTIQTWSENFTTLRISPKTRTVTLECNLLLKMWKMFPCRVKRRLKTRHLLASLLPETRQTQAVRCSIGWITNSPRDSQTLTFPLKGSKILKVPLSIRDLPCLNSHSIIIAAQREEQVVTAKIIIII